MEQGPPGMSEQNQPQQSRGNGQEHGQEAKEMERSDQQPQEAKGKDESAPIKIVSLHLQPIHIDLLGIVLKTDDINIEIDAEAGEGKLLGNLVRQLLPLIDKLHLDSVVGEFTNVLQDTLKGLAQEAGGKVKEHGAVLIGGLVGNAADRLKGKLHVPGGGGNGQHAPAPAESH